MRTRVVTGLVMAAAVLVPPAPAHAVRDGTARPDGLAVRRHTRLDEALQRDRGWSPAQARHRLAWEADQVDVQRRLRDTAGARFGGAWLTAGGVLAVGVTGERDATAARAAGAVAQPVAVPLAALEQAKAALDRNTATAPATLSSWYVDVPGNTLVIETGPGGTAEARRFATASGVTAPVRVSELPGRAAKTSYLVGGDSFGDPSGGCSVGFTVTHEYGLRGFVTAGHCRDASTDVVKQGANTLGSWFESDYPGSDMGWVQTQAGVTPTPFVHGGKPDNPQGYVNGSAIALIGATVCRSSQRSTTCGVVKEMDVTIKDTDGQVTQHLTAATVCVQPGDSGGPVFAGDQAQGVVADSRLDSACGEEPYRSYYQPIKPILDRYDLTLNTFWQGLAPVPGDELTTAGPAVTSYNFVEHLFLKSADEQVRFARRTATGWSAWSQVGPTVMPTSTKPAVVVHNGLLYVFVQRKATRTTQVTTFDGNQWTAWQELPGRESVSAPAAVVHDGKLRVIIRSAADDRLAEKVLSNGAWSSWSPLPGTGTTPDAPAAAVYNGMLYLAVRATGGQLYTNTYTTGWNGWQPMPGDNEYTASPVALTVFGESLRLFARGGGDVVYMNTYVASGWLGWTKVPGTFTGSDPAALRDPATGELHLYVRGADYQLHRNVAKIYY